MRTEAIIADIISSIEGLLKSDSGFKLHGSKSIIGINGIKLIALNPGRFGVDIPEVPSLLRIDTGDFIRAKFLGSNLTLVFERCSLSIEAQKGHESQRLNISYKCPQEAVN